MEDKSIKKIIKDHGLSDKEMKQELIEMGYRYFDTEEISEDAINEGFMWIPKYEVWIDKSNSLISEEELKLLSMIQ